MTRATMNMGTLTEAAHRMAPMMRTIAPSWIDRKRPYLSAAQTVNAAPMAEPAEFVPFIAPMMFAVWSYPGSPCGARSMST